MAHCTKCGAMVADGAAFCGGCGQPQAAGSSAAPAAGGGGATGTQVGGMENNVAAALAYLWLIAIVWLVMDPYNKDKFIRFHSFQALAFGVAWFVLNSVVWFLPFMLWMIYPLIALAGFVIWAVCLFKAFNKEWFKLPVIGDWAMKQAGN